MTTPAESVLRTWIECKDRVQIARKISAPATQSGGRASQKERRYFFRVSGWNLRGFVQLPED